MSERVKVIIAGSREFPIPFNLDLVVTTVNDALDCLGIKIEDVEEVSGTARGADRMGEEWARLHKVPVKKFPADWDTHGKSAGHIRNAEMAEYGDVLIAYWDGKSRGTKGMIDLATKKGLKVIVYQSYEHSEISYSQDRGVGMFSQTFDWRVSYSNCGKELDTIGG